MIPSVEIAQAITSVMATIRKSSNYIVGQTG